MPDVARTLDLPSGQRFEYWKHILTNTFVPLEVSTPGNGDDFRGLLRGCELGSLRFIEVSAEAHTARRTARLVKAAPAGCYKVLVFAGEPSPHPSGAHPGVPKWIVDVRYTQEQTTDLFVEVDPNQKERIILALKEAGNPDVTTVEFHDLNHLFQTCKTGAVSEYAAIEETMAPVALDTIAKWILKRTEK